MWNGNKYLTTNTTDGNVPSLQDGASNIWRSSNDRLYYNQSRSQGDRQFYLYYRNGWRTSRSTGNDNNGYAGNGWGATDYRATAYTVTTQTLTAGTTYSDFTISGDEYISSTGTNNSYTHTNSKVDAACTKYTFNSLTYYSTDPANAASTTRPQTEVTTGYTWSLSGNDSYASVNANTGEITVTSLPENDVVMTLTCTVSTKSATKHVTLTRAIPVAAGYVIYSGENNGNNYLNNCFIFTSKFLYLN